MVKDGTYCALLRAADHGQVQSRLLTMPTHQSSCHTCSTTTKKQQCVGLNNTDGLADTCCIHGYIVDKNMGAAWKPRYVGVYKAVKILSNANAGVPIPG